MAAGNFDLQAGSPGGVVDGKDGGGAGWAAVGGLGEGTVAVCFFADPEGAVVGVDALEVDGACGAGGDEGEGSRGFLLASEGGDCGGEGWGVEGWGDEEGEEGCEEEERGEHGGERIWG